MCGLQFKLQKVTIHMPLALDYITCSTAVASLAMAFLLSPPLISTRPDPGADLPSEEGGMTISAEVLSSSLSYDRDPRLPPHYLPHLPKTPSLHSNPFHIPPEDRSDSPGHELHRIPSVLMDHQPRVSPQEALKSQLRREGV